MESSSTFYELDSLLDKIKLLIINGENINYFDGHSLPILHSCADYYTDTGKIVNLVHFLGRNGADFNIKDNEGLTPLMKFIKYQANETIIELLLDYGANPNERDNCNRTALHFCSKYKLDSGADVVKLLVNHGADYNVRKYDGSTPLMDSIRFDGNRNVTKELLLCGADPNIPDLQSRNVLHICCRFFWLWSTEMSISLIEQLITHGADVFAKMDNGNTPLDELISLFDDEPSDVYVLKIIYILVKYMIIKDGQIWNRYYKKYFQLYKDVYSKIEVELTKCFSELSQMRTYYIKGKITLFSLCCVINRQKLGLYLKNCAILYDHNFNEDLLLLFPIYTDLIKAKIHFGKRWASILKEIDEKCILFVSKSGIQEIQLNHDCMKNIFSYLNEIDVKNVFTASIVQVCSVQNVKQIQKKS